MLEAAKLEEWFKTKSFPGEKTPWQGLKRHLGSSWWLHLALARHSSWPFFIAELSWAICRSQWSEASKTWLILPVVICLSQRLSHACLRISFNTTNLWRALYNSHSLNDDQNYKDIWGNSWVNTCAKIQLCRRIVVIRFQNQLWLRSYAVVNHDNCTNRIAFAGDKSFKFLTYQLDGRVVAYHGNDG